MKRNTTLRYTAITVLSILVACACVSFPRKASAKIEWEVLKNIALDEEPSDISLSTDGMTAYILCSKNILVYSIQDVKITDSIPLSGKFSQLELSNDGERLFLTESASKQISILRIEPIHDIDLADSPIIGKQDAPVSVVAFLDYQCPYCARVYPLLEELLARYPADVRLIIKHFPLRMHQYAENASLAALAASQQGKYKELTRLLMEHYKDLNDAVIKKLAGETGLDMQVFEGAMKDPSLKKIIGNDLAVGANVKVRGVPALFINGRTVKDRSPDALSGMVEAEIKKGNK
ncbi:MAG: thioredoxin domain-containing protein [Nitrospirae bacterium]|nr:thioredoxin domain-containing protein [Nitrospirota bacterium]